MPRTVQINSIDDLDRVAPPPATIDIEATQDSAMVTGVQDQLDQLLKGIQIIKEPDYSVRVCLPGEDRVTGAPEVWVHLRDMTGEDLEVMDSMAGSNITKTIKMISRLCVNWGAQPGVEVIQLRKARAAHIKVLGAVFARFLT